MRENRKYKFASLSIFSLIIIFLNLTVELSYGEINVWTSFLKNTSMENYILCRDEVILSLEDLNEWQGSPTYKNLLSNDENFGEFIRMVRKGNRYSIALAFELYPLTYKMGARNEKLTISLGGLILVDPEFFLQNLEKQKQFITGNYLNSLLAMYGDAYVDRNEKKKDLTNKRIESLRKVDNPNLQEIKIKCINILENYMSKLL